MLFKYEVETDKRGSFIESDALVQKALAESKLKSGVVVVFTPHTAAGVTINENADPDVVRDLGYGMNVTFDNKKEYRHAEGNSDSHMKSSLVGASETLIVDDGKIIYGTWQSLYFAEFDGPRVRKVYFKVVKG